MKVNRKNTQKKKTIIQSTDCKGAGVEVTWNQIFGKVQIISQNSCWKKDSVGRIEKVLGVTCD